MKTICIIEDDPSIQETYKTILAKEGFEIVVYSTGEEVTKKIAKISPAVIILDIMLPGTLNGLEVLKILKETSSLKAVPIVVLSNLEDKKNAALELGATEYFTKANVDIKTVLQTVKRLA